MYWARYKCTILLLLHRVRGLRVRPCSKKRPCSHTPSSEESMGVDSQPRPRVWDRAGLYRDQVKSSWDLGPRLHIRFGVGGTLNFMKQQQPVNGFSVRQRCRDPEWKDGLQNLTGMDATLLIRT